ncbi:MAG: hypothetical protein PHN31_01380 [Candidatus Gracilibacteria bacterium]|nr:hypothetical protein [Candidatus Gracilibacteria bacterium]
MNNTFNKNDIVIGGEYKHIYGGRYRVDDIKLDATGYEEKGEVGYTVCYTQLENGEKFPAGTKWHRLLQDFLGYVKIEGEIKKKFELIMNSKK